MRKIATINWVLALGCWIALGWCFHAGHKAAGEAVRTYGHNVDSGALIILLGIVYLVPASILLALAGAAFWKSWRIKWFVEVIAVAWLVIPSFALSWTGNIGDAPLP